MAYYEVKMNALRDGVVTETSSIDLVPGDVVFLRDPIKIPFEGIIIEGSALINECALTGESVPVVKKADVLEHYTGSEKEIDKSAYVFEGTTIIQVNSKKKMAIFESYREEYGVPVCVTRTNFLTLKGQLIRIILYPKEQENVFQRESAKFLIVLFFIAIITYFGMIPKLSDAVSGLDLFVKFLDLITITVPPALPISMTAGIIYALEKLKKKEIFCIEESRVITGGVVSFCCFDKTGTLTEDFMDFEALIPADKGQFFERVRNRADNKFHIETAVKEKPFLAGILSNMASNHSIIKIEETDELVGDPMEIKLFEFGKFSLNQSIEDPEVIFGF
jgi:cation-transporting P-type ATPase 13A2